jgi:hypothetical protein
MIIMLEFPETCFEITKTTSVEDAILHSRKMDGLICTEQFCLVVMNGPPTTVTTLPTYASLGVTD